MFAQSIVHVHTDGQPAVREVTTGVAVSLAAACLVLLLNWAGLPLAAASEFQLPPVPGLSH